MTFWKRQKDKESNQASNSQRFAGGEEMNYRRAKGTFGTKDIFSILIVVVLDNCMHLSKLKIVHQRG